MSYLDFGLYYRRFFASIIVFFGAIRKPQTITINNQGTVINPPPDANNFFWQQSLEERRHKQALKQQRMLHAREDKRIHAINQIVERAEKIKGADINLSINYDFFNFEDSNDTVNQVFIPFLTELKSAGCFSDFERRTGLNRVDFDFRGIKIENLLKFRQNDGRNQPVVSARITGQLRFDEGLNTIYFQDRKSIIPPNTNQFILAKKVFSVPLGAKVTETDILEAIDRQLGESNAKRTVYDAVRLLNDRIERDLGIRNLFKWARSTTWISL